ncbi:hypothetical protein M413DRAFT_341828 [Hebeloma cylindrosporum]|uniref:BZIP domain-containing protein n=1 Tax=Hebeloma cylindrosporum TaxID=76867 RepID=A0A0C2YWW1_HEBCY|nr:hypothetical protein M413DRAFT_341828 [Hebeloma cylindrosporum h7]
MSTTTTTTTTTHIDPSLFSRSMPMSFPSPAPSSSYTHDDEDDDHHHQQPSRKRARTSSSSNDTPSTAESATTKPTSLSEQRKEARAHRNRIAAQNSRDRRKAQFTYLERRVAELEEENRILRAAAHLASSAAAVPGGPAHVVPAPLIPSSAVFHAAATAATTSTHEEQARAERERERERENEALKERIRTLEEGWGAVVKALAAQGVPMLMAGAQAPPAAPTPETVAPEAKPTNQADMMAYTAFPSPAPSNASLDVDATLSASSSSSTTTTPTITTTTLTPTTTNTTTNPNSTRHLARVATAGGPSLARSASLQRVGWTVSSSGLGLNSVSTTALRRASAYQRALAMDKARRGEMLRRSCGKFSRSRGKGRARRR